MTFGGRIEFFQRGTRWVIVRGFELSIHEGARNAGRAIATSRLDEWCHDVTIWPSMVDLYEKLTGTRFRPPTSGDVQHTMKPALRRAFHEGILVAVEHGVHQRSEETSAGQTSKPKVEPPPPAPVSRHPAPAPKKLHSFAIRFVDEIGTAISGVDLSFGHGASNEDAKTDGNGVARIEDSAATTAKAKISNAKTLKNALKPRWDQPRGERKWLEESDGVTVILLKDSLPDFNLIADKLRVVSIQPCVVRVRLLGGFFDSSKSFVLPRGLDGVRAIVGMYDEVSKSKLLAVGHSDTAGKSDYNDKVSVERAEALKDYLADNVEGWLKWYAQDVTAEKRWGAMEDEDMIHALPDASECPFLEPPVRWFQRTRRLKVDGIAGPETRRALISEYMAIDGTSLPKEVEVVAHGCGENFPIDATVGDVADADDRRVEVYFFDGDLGVQPAPAGKNSKRGSTSYPEWVRRAKRTEDILTNDTPGGDYPFSL